MLKGILTGGSFGVVIGGVGVMVASVATQQPAGNTPPAPPQTEAPEASAGPDISTDIFAPRTVADPALGGEAPLVVAPLAEPTAPVADTDPLDLPQTAAVEGALAPPSIPAMPDLAADSEAPVLPNPQSIPPQIPESEADVVVSTTSVAPLPVQIPPVIVVEDSARPIVLDDLGEMAVVQPQAPDETAGAADADAADVAVAEPAAGVSPDAIAARQGGEVIASQDAAEVAEGAGPGVPVTAVAAGQTPGTTAVEVIAGAPTGDSPLPAGAGEVMAAAPSEGVVTGQTVADPARPASDVAALSPGTTAVEVIAGATTGDNPLPAGAGEVMAAAPSQGVVTGQTVGDPAQTASDVAVLTPGTTAIEVIAGAPTGDSPLPAGAGEVMAAAPSEGVMTGQTVADPAQTASDVAALSPGTTAVEVIAGAPTGDSPPPAQAGEVMAAASLGDVVTGQSAAEPVRAATDARRVISESGTVEILAGAQASGGPASALPGATLAPAPTDGESIAALPATDTAPVLPGRNPAEPLAGAAADRQRPTDAREAVAAAPADGVVTGQNAADVASAARGALRVEPGAPAAEVIAGVPVEAGETPMVPADVTALAPAPDGVAETAAGIAPRVLSGQGPSDVATPGPVDPADVVTPRTAGNDSAATPTRPVIVADSEAQTLPASPEAAAVIGDTARADRPEPQGAVPVAPDGTAVARAQTVPDTAVVDTVAEAATAVVVAPVAGADVVASAEGVNVRPNAPGAGQQSRPQVVTGTTPDEAPSVTTPAPAPPPVLSIASSGDTPRMPGGNTGVRVNRPLTAEPAAPEVDQPTAPPASEAPALQRYAAAFDDPGDKPLMAIVVIDTGNVPSPELALSALPFPVTVALDPTLPGAAARMAAYRGAGIEVAIRPALPDGATPGDVEIALSAGLDILPQTVLLIDDGANAALDDPAITDQVISALAEEGRGYLSISKGLNSALRTAESAGVPAQIVFRDLDGEGQDARVMGRFIDQAAFRARQTSAVVLMARLRPETLSALTRWGNATRADQVTMAPASAVLLAQ